MTDLEKEDIVSVAQLPYDWDKLENKTVLLSGGTGFIGSFLLDVFRYRNEKYENGIRVVSLSRRGGNSDGTVLYQKADVTNPVVYQGTVDYVLHLASNTHPHQYAEDPVGTILTNILGCEHLLQLAAEKNARFLLPSSVEIYGEGTEAAMDEQCCGYLDCNQARAGYNEAKRTCEALCQSYRKQYGIDFVTVRLGRVFGADRKKDTKAIAQFMEKALADEDIILKSNGTQRYSYCYVADCVSGIIRVLLDGVCGQAYNLSEDDEGMTLAGYAERIAKLAGRKVVYQMEEDEAVSKATYALLNTEKLKGIGWKPLYSVSEGLERTYKIYTDRMEFPVKRYSSADRCSEV